MKRIYLDTEYCYPGMVRGTPRPTAADKRQVVQIAAVIFDSETGKEISQFDQLVTPAYETQVPDYFVELTGISQESINDKAIDFDEALTRFVEFVDGLPIWTFDKDEEVLRQNCAYVGTDWPFEDSFTRVKSLLPIYGIDADTYSSGTLHKAADLDMDGHVHNALHDVRSMSQAIHAFECKTSN